MKTKILLLINLIAINCYGMQEAINEGDVQAVARLLNQGVDVNSTIQFAGHHISLLNCAAIENQIGIVQLLILRGANVDSIDHCECTSLHSACSYDNLDLAKLLLENGANPDLSSVPPLFLAIEHRDLKMVELLIKHKASVLVKDWLKQSVFNIFSNETPPEIIDLLNAIEEQELKEIANKQE